MASQLTPSQTANFLMAYHLQALDTSGNDIDSIRKGEEFFLQMTAQDLRPELFNRTIPG